jgi:heptaprenyl diphosphate synthase
MTRTHRLTAAAALTAVAVVLHIAEAWLPPLTAVPGIKLGLANAATLFAVGYLGRRWAAGVLTARVLIGGLLFGGPTAAIYAVAGGAVSFAVVAALKFPRRQLWVISALASVAHNAAQLVTAMVITATPQLIAYFPVLIISGVVTGVFTGACAELALTRIENRQNHE